MPDLNSVNYEIRVKGHLDPKWSDWFEGLSVGHQPNGETTLAGPIVDQAALQSVLIKISRLGLTLVSVQQVTPEGERRYRRRSPRTSPN